MSVALVTGANRGIGREVVRQLAGRGFDVLLGARDLRAGDDAARQIGGTVTAIALNVRDDGSVSRAADAIRERFGLLDVLVNNAAIGYEAGNRACDVDLAFVQDVFTTNLWGAWQVTQAMLPLLRASAHARIVNVSSEAGSLASMDAGTPAYATSKAALNAFTRILAGELHGAVLVNAVCPGWTATDMGGSGGRPIADGAASVVWGALLSDDGPTGGFFRDGRPLPW